uniref:C-type lectin domain-containing protein n=1 Tax=Poecilia latipinna TaxID=48699 RepID=A0A3B3VZZ6_9TELE
MLVYFNPFSLISSAHVFFRNVFILHSELGLPDLNIQINGKFYFKNIFLNCTVRCIFLLSKSTNGMSLQKKSWQEAQSYCREKHTDLISGTKQLQDEEVKNLKITAYFGLFRDTWRWSDGSNSSFRHWNNELSNVKYNSGQCAMTVFDDETRWKNENCDERKPFICYDGE